MQIRKNLDFLATLFFETGVTYWAVSPGSRNAPIVAAFVRHGGFELHSFPDERCAAFAALGMSQATGYACGVICTSGTAVLNLYPAICEAFYQRVPMIVLTADRPEELLDQWDGQTIHQNQIFEKHILESFETPQNLGEKECFKDLEKIIYTAVKTSITPILGPVHINIPMRDPIYAGINELFFQQMPEKHFVFVKPIDTKPDVAFLRAELTQFRRILIVAGQHAADAHMEPYMANIASKFPLLADITSNFSKFGVDGWEMGLQTVDENFDLQPELLITFGLSVTSKKLKQFLRNFPPAEHWHISASGFTGDPFGSNPDTKTIEPISFFETVSEIAEIDNFDYLKSWNDFAEKGKTNYAPLQIKNTIYLTEFEIVRSILKHSDETVTLQIGNSMAIRYAGWEGKTNAEVHCNRGTSGIDGTLSTAVGYALAKPDKKTICVLGDVSFFYDSNGLWTDHLPPNLQIVIINNYGGKIFNYIDGPNQEPALMPLIQTPHKFDAEHIAAHFGIPYFSNTLPFIEEKLIEGLLQNQCCIYEYLIHEDK